MSNPTTGIHQAVFGEVTEDDVTEWLDRHVRRRLATGAVEVLFRSGRLAAVCGLRLAGGERVVAKVHRSGANVDRLAAAVACQGILADAGYPCPRPLDGPVAVRPVAANPVATGSVTAGPVTAGPIAGSVAARPVAAGPLVVVLESWLDAGEVGDAHQPAVRQAMASALAEQVDLLRGVPAAASPLADPPAWIRYEGGPWPVPHDPIFDFTHTPPGHAWLDHLARDAADVLGPRGEPEVIVHGDWYCGNLRFVGTELSAAWDWDSLTAHHEPVLAGVAAGSHTDGSAAGAAAPAPYEVAAFLATYDECRGAPFTNPERAAAAAAAVWVMAYNARCQLAMTPPGQQPGEGSFLWRLARERDGYLRLLRDPG